MDSVSQLDWAQVRVFAAVSDAGSLSGAARALGISQPTVGRQIQALETVLGVALFTRKPRGLDLTDAGQRLLPSAREMMEAASRFALVAAGQDAGIAGTVRITASVYISHYVLPRMVARLRIAEPLIQIEVAPSDTSENLLFREADIAIRMYRPTQLDVVTRHIGDIRTGAFATRAYLDRHGRPRTEAELLDHDIIGYDRSDLIIRGLRDAGWDVRREDFPLRTDNQSVYWELVRAGCGIGFGQVHAALRDPTLEQVLPDLPIPPLPVWLATHAAMRHTPRIERVWRHLADALTDYCREGHS